MAVRYKRILLKLSGEALSGKTGFGLDVDTIQEICGGIKAAHELGAEIAIVVGGGNFWRGRSSGEMERTRADPVSYTHLLNIHHGSHIDIRHVCYLKLGQTAPITCALHRISQWIGEVIHCSSPQRYSTIHLFAGECDTIRLLDVSRCTNQQA